MRYTLAPLKIMAIFSVVGCAAPASDRTVEISPMAVESYTLYSNPDSVVHVARGLKNENGGFELLRYDVDVSRPEDARQRSVSSEPMGQQQLEGRRAGLQGEYGWTPFKGDAVLFIQIRPAGSETELDVMSKRQEVEDKLNSVFEREKLGEWFAGDMGPGGGNILYSVYQVDSAMQAILGVLRQFKVEGITLIGRRVLLSDQDWFYEVIYPTNYSGDFNTM